MDDEFSSWDLVSINLFVMNSMIDGVLVLR